MVMLLEGGHLQIFVHKKIDPSSYGLCYSFVWIIKLIILCRFCKTLFLPEFLSNHVFPDLSSIHWITILLDKGKGSICSLVKWANTVFLALHGSRPMLGTNFGLMMYMSGDPPFIAWMKTGGWTEFPYVEDRLKIEMHLYNVSIPGQRRRQWPSIEPILCIWYGQFKRFKCCN